MKSYRTGFLLALFGNIMLAVVLAGLWLHYRGAKAAPDIVLHTPPSALEASPVTAPPSSNETALVPVQISAPRLQSIGVKTGNVERKLIEDEIRTTGTVAIDETKLAYVQVRYSGFIEK